MKSFAVVCTGYRQYDNCPDEIDYEDAATYLFETEVEAKNFLVCNFTTTLNSIGRAKVYLSEDKSYAEVEEAGDGYVEFTKFQVSNIYE